MYIDDVIKLLQVGESMARQLSRCGNADVMMARGDLERAIGKLERAKSAPEWAGRWGSTTGDVNACSTY